MHICIQHEHSPGVVFTYQYVYIDSINVITVDMLTGKDDEDLRPAVLHESYKPVLGAAAWTALTSAELAAYVQALQGRAEQI